MADTNSGRLRSSCLTFYEYDFRREVLGLTFTDGTKGYYSGVPPYVFAGLLAAPSKGTYFNSAIRNSFSYSRVG
jgi:hypothetical protein